MYKICKGPPIADRSVSQTLTFSHFLTFVVHVERGRDVTTEISVGKAQYISYTWINP